MQERRKAAETIRENAREARAQDSISPVAEGFRGGATLPPTVSISFPFRVSE